MPLFQNKEFPYTAAGKKAAAKYAAVTGEKPIKKATKKKKKSMLKKGK